MPTGGAKILRTAIYPTLRGPNVAAVAVQQRAVLLAPKNQHGGAARDVIRLPAGPATRGLAAATY